MPPTEDSQTTFKPNLTCIFLSARTRYIISIPNGGPCTIMKQDLRLPFFEARIDTALPVGLDMNRVYFVLIKF